MQRRMVVAAIAVIWAVAGLACAFAAESSKEVDLQLAMRSLWSEHVGWTRTYIISAVASLPDTDIAAARLLKNQDDIGAAIKPYYGDAAGNKLAELLRSHITAAAEVVAAAKAGDAARVTAAQKKWSDNADEIAAFLSGANPHWTKKALGDMLHEHLSLTTDEAVARIKQNWDADAAAFDRVHAQAMKMADELSAGIIKQFPRKFEKVSY